MMAVHASEVVQCQDLLLFPEEKNHPAQFSFNKNSALLCLECAQMAGSRDKVGINVALQPKPEP